MAELEYFSTDDLNPCAQCAGHRHLVKRSWSDPQFWVTCDGCNTMVGGETAADARLGWNAVNAPREVAPEDVLAHEAALLQKQLTPPVLAALDQAQALWYTSGQTGSVETFVAWCHQFTPVETTP